MIVGMFSAEAGFRILPITLLAIALTITACNDAPTDLGSDLVPGTDSLYAASSLQQELFDSVFTASMREPAFNGTYVLFGRTADAEARMFVEFIDYPSFGPADSFSVVQADLIMIPQAYLYGDTASRTLSMTGYELQKLWSPTATWDSIWAQDGSSTYYSTAQKPICTVSKDLTATDSIVSVPLDPAAAKSWLVKGPDSLLRKELFGLVFVPTGGSSIRLYRAFNNAASVMRLRVATKRLGRDTIDTTFIEAAIAGFVNAPSPSPGALLVQGAQVYRTQFDVDLSTIPHNAVIMSATLRVTVDTAASTSGNGPRDEVLRLSYSPAGSLSPINLSVRGDDATKTFRFGNLASLVQDMMRNGRKGTLRIGPDGANELWRMNRVPLFPMTADTARRPKLSIIYSTPSVIK